MAKLSIHEQWAKVSEVLLRYDLTVDDVISADVGYTASILLHLSGLQKILRSGDVAFGELNLSNPHLRFSFSKVSMCCIVTPCDLVNLEEEFDTASKVPDGCVAAWITARKVSEKLTKLKKEIGGDFRYCQFTDVGGVVCCLTRSGFDRMFPERENNFQVKSDEILFICNEGAAASPAPVGDSQ